MDDNHLLCSVVLPFPLLVHPISYNQLASSFLTDFKYLSVDGMKLEVNLFGSKGSPKRLVVPDLQV